MFTSVKPQESTKKLIKVLNTETALKAVITRPNVLNQRIKLQCVHEYRSRQNQVSSHIFDSLLNDTYERTV